MEFLHADYEVLETEGQVVAIVTRSGDINQRSKVRCYTRQASAEVAVDYVERPDTNDSFVEFLPGIVFAFSYTGRQDKIRFILSQLDT